MSQPLASSFWRGLRAVARKEWLQLRLDRLTLALLLGVPLAQVLLFGFAIELSPRHWPAAWVQSYESLDGAIGPVDAELDQQLTQAMLTQLRAGGLLQIAAAPLSESDGASALQKGEVRLLLTWPRHPSAAVLRQQPVALRLQADLSDPQTRALLAQIGDGLAHRLVDRAGPASAPAQTPSPTLSVQGLPMQLQVQGLHHLPDNSGAYLVPALSGVVLTLTLTLMAALCLVREIEQGTWDSLRTTPLSAGQILLGKILPYAWLGLLQYALLQALAWSVFGTAWASPALWLLAACFMAGQLGLGLCLSLLARSQLQAVQLGVFFYLPSILLSGFMFPFHAMPAWARALGECLPLTHFLRAMRAELFRQADAHQLWQLGWPVPVFAALMLLLAWLGYRRRV